MVVGVRSAWVASGMVYGCWFLSLQFCLGVFLDREVESRGFRCEGVFGGEDRRILSFFRFEPLA